MADTQKEIPDIRPNLGHAADQVAPLRFPKNEKMITSGKASKVKKANQNRA